MATLRPSRAVASFDSASAFLSSLARALEHRGFDYLGQSPLKVPLVRASAVLPTRLRTRAYAVASGREGVPPERLGAVDMDRVAAWVTGRYHGRHAPAVLLGSSNGALNHLAAACGAPWLPQTLLVPVRRPGADPEDYAGAERFGREHGAKLLDRNPDVQLHHMHDPNQDALSSSQMAYFRVKWRSLPLAYQEFLSDRLQPGAPVIVVRDTSSWPVTRVGERHVFQLGAQGGMSAGDYLEAPGAPNPDNEAPEAEWGFADGLLDSIGEWAARHRHPVVEIGFEHPQRPAAAVAQTMRDWLRRGGAAGTRLMVSSFIVHDPWETIRTGSVPFWTFFPVASAAQDLAAYLETTDYDEIDVMLFNHGTRSRGMADAATWEALAGRARGRGRLLGVDPGEFPADFQAFVRYSRELKALPSAEHAPGPLDLREALEGLARDPRIVVRTVTPA